MGEIIFSICIGGFLAISGLIMIFYLRKEEKSFTDKNGEVKS